MNLKEFCLRLKLQQGIGITTLGKIAENFTSKEEVTVDKIETLSLKSNIQNLVFAAMKNDKFNSWIEKIELQCNVVTIFDSIYPDRLREMYNPPTLLFTRGDLSLLQKEITVVVGARQPTSYSRFVLKQLIPQLIEQDFVIASGLARGVDGIAHRETLNNHGKTIAVVGNGLNHFYPQENKALQEEIVAKGLLISEYLPDTPPRPYRFPERNRI
ncbi:DNA-protecting protein DprA [Lactobacillus taiwanensis]|nr:DNA-protecting protein DprA [Lactobacillus taiwanensis]